MLMRYVSPKHSTDLEYTVDSNNVDFIIYKLMDWETFDRLTQENLSEMLKYFEGIQAEKKDSNLFDFSLKSTTEDLVEAVALKLRVEEGINEELSLIRAREIVEAASLELRKPGVRKKICALFKSLTSDSFALLPFLYGLVQIGTLSIPFDPTGTLLISIVAVMLTKASIESLCSE